MPVPARLASSIHQGCSGSVVEGNELFDIDGGHCSVCDDGLPADKGEVDPDGSGEHDRRQRVVLSACVLETIQRNGDEVGRFARLQ